LIHRPRWPEIPIVDACTWDLPRYHWRGRHLPPHPDPPKLAHSCRPCRCSPTLYVVRCGFGGTLRSAAVSGRPSDSTFNFSPFFIILSMSHPPPPSRVQAQDNCGNRGMVGEHVDVRRSSPARRDSGMASKLVSRATVKFTFARGKNLCTQRKRKRKTS
jgi:hypothetical protein